jgi:chromosome segregation ATPase
MTTVNNNKALTPVKAVAPAAKPAVAKTVSVASDAPRTPNPTKAKLSALAQMQADKPSFGNPDEYKNYVIKFAGYIKDARDEHEIANRALEAEKAKEADASAEYSKPLNAAKKVYEDTHALYQGAIDKTSRDLSTAKSDLDDAVYPGKRKAAELDREAADLANQISRIDGDIRSARSRISSLESGINTELSRRSSAESSRSAAESEIRRLEPQAPSDSALTSQRSRVNDAASRLSSANSRLSDASTKLNRARDLQRAVDTLSSIDSQYDSAVDSRSSLKGWVGRRQTELTNAQATGDAAKITAAKSAYDEALQKYNAADQKVRSYESQMSQYGASPSTINSVISSKKSELAGLSGAQSEYDSASSAKSSAQATYNTEKSRLDTMQNLADELDRNYDKKNTAVRTINEANARIASYTGEKSQLNTSIYQLQDQLDTKTRQRTNVVAEANRERARQNPADHPQVVAAKRRVDDLTSQLKQNQDTYNEKIRAPKAKVDEEQTKYNNNMAPYRAKVADATRIVGEKAAAVETIKKEFDGLKDIGGFKKFWWKLRYHFDVNEFWKQQGNQVALQVNEQAKTALA